MPIPGDSLNREWVDASSHNPTFVDEYRPCLIAFLAFDHGHVPRIAGSGFIIGHSEDLAIALTAKHVLTEGVLGIQRPSPRHAPSALFVPTSATMPSIDESRLRACWMGSEIADLLFTRHIAYNDTLDIACAIFEPQGFYKKEFKPASILLDTNEPSLGDVVHMISLDGLEISNYSPPTDISGAGFAFSISRRVSIRVGTVTGVYPQGFRQYKWPCFTTSIPAEPGMSGGMVSVRNREPVSICGIVSADNSSEESRTNNALCGESVIASAWAALSMNVPKVIDVNPPMQSIYEMMKLNQMPAAIGIENIIYIDRGYGDGTIGNRNR
jgi:hypothetical protein